MEQIQLQAKKRTEIGSQAAKDFRKRDVIPCVVYKKGVSTLNIAVGRKEFFNILHTSAGRNVIIDLRISDGDGQEQQRTVRIKEIQYHPIKDEILHIDFKQILLTDTIKVKVPLKVKGEAIGVKRDGGLLEHILWEVDVECLPTAIPEYTEVDVSNMEIGNSIHVNDLIILSGGKILNSPEDVVIIIEPPKKEEEEVVEEAVEGEEPEVIKQKKPDEESGEAGKEEK